jgi:hypothetical protein
MILRRITEHVKAQNWFAVGLDFVIVVVGVFIGIQVANWNEERLQAREGAQFTARLQTDLRYEQENWQALVAYLGVVRANADSTAAILERRVQATDEALLVHAYRATQYMYTVRWRATYEELASTGSLGLIKDQALRDTAVQFYLWPGIENAFEEGSKSPYRSLFRGSMPIEVQDALTRHCGDRLTRREGLGEPRYELDYESETGLTATQIAAAAALLRGHPDLLHAVRLRAMNLRTMLSDLTDASANIAEGLRSLLEASP